MADYVDIDGLRRQLALAEGRVAELQAAEQALRESEERQAYFLTLSDALRPLGDQETIQAEALRLLGEKIGVNRAQYYIADETGEYLSSSGGYSNGIAAAIGNFHLIEFGKYAYDGFHAGQTQVVSDATTDPRISEEVLRSYREVGFLAYIGVPFVQRGRLVGTLAVHQSQPRQWTENERLMVEETAQRAGIAVEQARAEAAFRESQERQAFLSKLSDTLRPLASSVDIQRETTQLLGNYLGVDRCYYFETDHHAGEYIIYRDFKRGNLRSLAGRHPISQWPEMTAALSSGKMLVVDDYANSADIPPDERQPTENLDISAIILVPLVKQGILVACIAVIQSVPRKWKSTEASLVTEVAERTWSAVERARAEVALRESDERFRQFANAAAAGLWIRDAGSLSMEFTSRAVGTVYGVESDSLLGDVQQWAAMIVPEDRDKALAHLASARNGKTVVHEFRILRGSDGTFRWIRNTDFPLESNGHVQRIGGIAEDVTEAKLAIEHQGVLLAELQHRVRNIMAMIRSMANRTAPGAEDKENYRSLLEGRLLALARVQALLTRGGNTGGSLRHILQEEIAAQAHHGGQYELTGPEVMLSPKAVEVLTLAFHELATNALKYGALSVPDGKLAVSWASFEKKDKCWLALDWQETGGPQREPSKRRGFGSELIEARVAYELRGSGKITIGPGGAHCRLEFPLSQAESILETDAPQQRSVFGGTLDMTGAPDLTGRSVLLVEDDYYMAADAAAALRGAGAEVLGPCPDEAAVINLLTRETPTHAVLDLNLGGGGPRFEIARMLTRRRVPFLFLTGYDPDIIPAELTGVVRLQKPVPFREIVNALNQL